MKKLSSLLFCLAVLICLTLFTAPKTEAATYGDFTYEVNNGEITITNYVEYYYAKTVNIPSSIDGYPVTAIGDLRSRTAG